MQRLVVLAGAAVCFGQVPLVEEAAFHVRAGLKEISNFKSITAQHRITH